MYPLQPLLLASLVVLWTQIGCALAAQKCFLVPPANRRVNNVGAPRSSSVSSSSVVLSTTLPSSSTSSSSPSPTPFTPFSYGQTPVRGVNLGGWFVLEPWITPSVFVNTNNTNVVDEYTFGKLLDDDTALEILQQHWETWITEEDFIAIAAAGLTHVRIPLGYWSVPTNASVAPYIPGAFPYFKKALSWAHAHNVHVIVDLHGAPGSQNGYDNSGHRTSAPQWALDQDNVNQTLDVLRVLAGEVGSQVDAIELLNEAAGFLGNPWTDVIRQFWQDGYDVVRDAAGSGVKVVIGDAFEGVNSWQDFLTGSSAQGVLMDYHEYQIFSDAELARSHDEHISFACDTLMPNLTSFANSNLWTVSGEWSTAITDCAKWLNGRGVGARWDGTYGDGNAAFGSCTGYTGSSSSFSSSYKAYLRKYWEVQVEIGEAVQGWIYWTWKAENADEWSYQKGLEGGWIPQDPSDRMYPSICG